MKKKNLLAKLNLSRETVLQLSEKNHVTGGGEITTPTDTMVKTCTAVTWNPPCCPACRSGLNGDVKTDYGCLFLETNDCVNPVG